MLYRWQRFSACADMDQGLFYDYEKPDTKGVRTSVPLEAKEACKSCPVRNSCLEYALKYEDFGFWAGTTRGQRRKLRIKLDITPISPEGVSIYHDENALLVG